MPRAITISPRSCAVRGEGSQLVELLLADGARVRAFVRYNSRADPGLLSLVPPAGELRGSLEMAAGDLRDPQAIREAVKTGGRIFYETFTRRQAERGRPRNPAFLLEEGELERLMAPFTILQSREGDIDGRFIASVIAER